MGQSTDAILFYGYCWDEERNAPWDDKDEATWTTRYAKRMGVAPAPDAEYPPDKDTSPAAELLRETFKAAWAREREAEKQCPVMVSSHCSADSPIPYVAIKASHMKAWRGYPKEVPGLVTDPAWRKQLDDFCALMDIKPPQDEPRWWLVSDWN